MVMGDFTTSVDVLVIGGGPAGYTAAIRAAQLGKEVTLVERQDLGGVCLNRGCIPSKALLSASNHYYQMNEKNDMGIKSLGAEIDFPAMQEWKESVITQLTKGVGKLLQENKISIIKGEAVFSSESVVRVITEYRSEGYQFNECIIATGSTIKKPSVFPTDPSILSSDEALRLKEIPNQLLVVGEGYIAIELATVYRKLGSEVTILSKEEQLLPDFDPSLVRMVSRRLKKLGIQIDLKASDIKIIEQEADHIKVQATIKDKMKEWRIDKMLLEDERQPNITELGLEMAKVTLDDEGYIVVDDQQRTSNPHVYAIGDVVGRPMLAHKGSYEGKIAAEVIAGNNAGNVAIAIPKVIYGDPELVSVGLTEEEAKNLGHEIQTGKFLFGASGRALTRNKNEGFVQVVADQSTKAILGVHMVGENVSEMVTSAVYAIEMGMTIEDVALTMHAHPTLSEGLMEAAEAAMGMAIHVVNR
jgi:dihydrolipoamide dehydrogenase